MEKLTGAQQAETIMSRSYVVTGGGRGIGRAVVAIEFDQSALALVDDNPAGRRVIAVIGDAAKEP